MTPPRNTRCISAGIHREGIARICAAIENVGDDSPALSDNFKAFSSRASL